MLRQKLVSMGMFGMFGMSGMLGMLSMSACGGGKDGPLPDLPEERAGSCTYTNNFSGGIECRDYLGAWTVADAQNHCASQKDSSFSTDQACDQENTVGVCVLKGDTEAPSVITFASGTCLDNERGCEIFGGGLFGNVGSCSSDVPQEFPTTIADPFPEPEYSCVEPLEGDAAGNGEGGKVCQWLTMQGCTEPGRNWADYGSCEIPFKQNPYYPVPVADNAELPDPRMDDPTYAAEVAWVRDELSSCSCVCCHSTNAPEGPANWYLEQEGNFINGMFDTGIARGAGHIDSVVLGNIEPDENNGFTRLPSIFPSTDPERMLRFFQAEFAHRGLNADDFIGKGRYGPLSDQYEFIPDACADGIGVDPEGRITWGGGNARMVYILEEDSKNPLTPPNLDTPAGTLWRLDTSDATVDLIRSGLLYGDTSGTGGTGSVIQKFPIDAPPAALESGKTYYLYVLADYITPIERCLFTF